MATKKTVHALLNELANDNINLFDYFDLDSIPTEALERQNVDLSIYVANNGFGHKILYDESNIITEEATRTLTVDEVKNELKKTLKLEDWQIKTENGANGIKLILLFFNLSANENIIIEEMKACGWSKAITQKVFYRGYYLKSMSFDPMFQDNVNDEVRNNKFLFHWTKTINLQSIQKNGLEPRSDNNYFQYPKRIHLMKSNINEDDAISLVKQLYNKSNKNNSSEYSLLQIFINEIPLDVDFYYDPRFEMGYYCNKTIAPNAISVIGNFDVLKDKIINYTP